MFALMGNCMKWANGNKESRKSVTIIAVGLDNAGKTTTVHGVKGYANDDVTPTMGFSSVDLSSGKFNVKIFDLGGGARIRGIWQNYMAEAHAVIFVIDSSDVSRMDECRVTFEGVVSDSRISGKPVLILANKQDKPGAIDESELCDRLNLEEIVNVHQCPSRVEHCTAIPAEGRRKPKKLDRGIKTGFAWLLDVIGSEYDVLHARILKDVQEQKEREAEEHAKRIERVRKIREERERREKEGIPYGEEDRSQPDGISSPIEGNDHNSLLGDPEHLEDGIQDPDQQTLADLGKEAIEMSHNQETGLGRELVNDELDTNVFNKSIVDNEPIISPPLPGAVNVTDPIELQEESNNRIGSPQDEESEHPNLRSLSKASLREIIQKDPTPQIYQLPGTPTYQTPIKSTLGSVVDVEKDDQSDDAVIATESSQPKPKKKRRKKKRRHNKIDVLQSADNLNEVDHPRPLPGRLTPLKIGTNGGNVKDDAFGTIQ